MPRSDIDHYAGLTYWGPYDERTIGAWLDAVSLQPDAEALDIGCGDGALMRALARRFGCRTTSELEDHSSFWPRYPTSFMASGCRWPRSCWPWPAAASATSEPTYPWIRS